MAAPAIGFSLDEDHALRMKLEGYGTPYTVTNYADGRVIPIAAYYRSPDPEIRKRTFPHVAIDLINIEPDHERMHRSAGMVVPSPTETATPASGTVLWADDFPFPWMLIYQLSAISRDPTHDRQLGQLLYHMFPYQFGQLDMTMFDSTVRRADLRSTIRRDLPSDQANKRIFRQIFTIAVSSEFYVHEVVQIPLVTDVNVDVEEWVKEN